MPRESVQEPTSEAGIPADAEEKRRLSLFHLIGLAAGGVIGSGWLLGGAGGYQRVGGQSYQPWLVGGVIVLVIAAVMVELGTAAPKTGGLIFLPLQSSGALVATVIAAGLWIFYAINLASEAVAMTRGLAWRVGGLIQPGKQESLTGSGWAASIGFMVVISALNLLAPWLFFRISSWVNVVKVAIPGLAVLLLATPLFASFQGKQPPDAGAGLSTVLGTVVGGGVIYSYFGFQGPLDFAGNVRRRGIGEAARLRWAVLGTVVGSTVLYVALKIVLGHYFQTGLADGKGPLEQFALSPSSRWLGWLLMIDTLLAPLGAGLVFAHALTREVATLSRSHLTHRGLRTARYASLRRRYDVYWLVLVVDFFVALVVLCVVGGKWTTLAGISGVLSLIVYAFPGVVLVSVREHLPACSPARRRLRAVLAPVSFTLIALLLYGAGWTEVWRGMVALTIGCVVLLGLPVLSAWLPVFNRIYDAQNHVTLFRRWRTSATAQAGMCFLGFLAMLTALTMVGNPQPNPDRHGHARDPNMAAGVAVAVLAFVTFRLLVRLSRRHMAVTPPILPPPTAPPGADPSPQRPDDLVGLDEELATP